MLEDDFTKHQILKSKKGKPMLIYLRRAYHFTCITNGITKYRCSNRRCRGRISVTGESFEVTYAHVCLPLTDLEMKNFLVYLEFGQYPVLPNYQPHWS
jgi:hypothetical protein